MPVVPLTLDKGMQEFLQVHVIAFSFFLSFSAPSLIISHTLTYGLQLAAVAQEKRSFLGP